MWIFFKASFFIKVWLISINSSRNRTYPRLKCSFISWKGETFSLYLKIEVELSNNSHLLYTSDFQYIEFNFRMSELEVWRSVEQLICQDSDLVTYVNKYSSASLFSLHFFNFKGKSFSFFSVRLYFSDVLIMIHTIVGLFMYMLQLT